MFKKKIFKTIFKYAIPNVISMWIFTLYTMIDGVFISRFVGPTALAGVNLALPLINFIFSISIMAVSYTHLNKVISGKAKYIHFIEIPNETISISSFFMNKS